MTVKELGELALHASNHIDEECGIMLKSEKETLKGVLRSFYRASLDM